MDRDRGVRRDKIREKLLLLDDWLSRLSLLGAIKCSAEETGNSNGSGMRALRPGRPSELRRHIDSLADAAEADAEFAMPASMVTQVMVLLLLSSSDASLLLPSVGRENRDSDFASVFNEALATQCAYSVEAEVGESEGAAARLRDDLLRELSKPPSRGFTWLLRHMLGLAGGSDDYTPLFCAAALDALQTARSTLCGSRRLPPLAEALLTGSTAAPVRKPRPVDSGGSSNPNATVVTFANDVLLGVEARAAAATDTTAADAAAAAAASAASLRGTNSSGATAALDVTPSRRISPTSALQIAVSLLQKSPVFSLAVLAPILAQSGMQTQTHFSGWSMQGRHDLAAGLLRAVAGTLPLSSSGTNASATTADVTASPRGAPNFNLESARSSARGPNFNLSTYVPSDDLLEPVIDVAPGGGGAFLSPRVAPPTSTSAGSTMATPRSLTSTATPFTPPFASGHQRAPRLLPSVGDNTATAILSDTGSNREDVGAVDESQVEVQLAQSSSSSGGGGAGTAHQHRVSGGVSAASAADSSSFGGYIPAPPPYTPRQVQLADETAHTPRQRSQVELAASPRTATKRRASLSDSSARNPYLQQPHLLQGGGGGGTGIVSSTSLRNVHSTPSAAASESASSSSSVKKPGVDTGPFVGLIRRHYSDLATAFTGMSPPSVEVEVVLAVMMRAWMNEFQRTWQDLTNHISARFSSPDSDYSARVSSLFIEKVAPPLEALVRRAVEAGANFNLKQVEGGETSVATVHRGTATAQLQLAPASTSPSIDGNIQLAPSSVSVDAPSPTAGGIAMQNEGANCSSSTFRSSGGSSCNGSSSSDDDERARLSLALASVRLSLSSAFPTLPTSLLNELCLVGHAQLLKSVLPGVISHAVSVSTRRVREDVMVEKDREWAQRQQRLDDAAAAAASSLSSSASSAVPSDSKTSSTAAAAAPSSSNVVAPAIDSDAITSMTDRRRRLFTSLQSDLTLAREDKEAAILSAVAEKQRADDALAALRRATSTSREKKNDACCVVQ